MTVDAASSGLTFVALGPGARFLDQASADAGETFFTTDFGLIELAAAPNPASQFAYIDNGTGTAPGTIAFEDPGSIVTAPVTDAEAGDVLEVPGSLVESIVFGTSSLTITTNAGSYDFTNFSQNAISSSGIAVGGYTAAIDPVTGLEAITFAAPDTFVDSHTNSLPPGPLPAYVLWSVSANWSNGVPVYGNAVIEKGYGADDLNNLTLGVLDLSAGGLDVTGASLTADDVTGANNELTAAAYLSGAPVVVTVNGVHSGLYLQARGAGAEVIDNAGIDAGDIYELSQTGLIELAATPNAASTFYYGLSAHGTFAFQNPGATNAALLENVAQGAVLELPGTSVDSVTFGGNSLTVTTDAGSYAFTNVSFQGGISPVNGYTAAFDAKTGLEAITFTGPDIFEQNQATNGAYLWSTPANWTNGVPLDGESVIDGVAGTDDLVSLSLAALDLSGGGSVFVTGANLTAEDVTGSGGTLTAAAFLSGAPVVVTVNGVGSGVTLAARGLGAQLIDTSGNDAGDPYDVIDNGLVELAAAPDAGSDFFYGSIGNTIGGTFASEAPGAVIASSLTGVAPGDVLEVPGTTVDTVTFGSNSLSVTTDQGTYDFTDVSYLTGSPIGGFNATHDAATGLEAITFAASNSFLQTTTTALADGANDYTWSTPANWTYGEPSNGGVVDFDFNSPLSGLPSAYDDIANLELSQLNLLDGYIEVAGTLVVDNLDLPSNGNAKAIAADTLDGATAASLTIDSVTGNGAKIGAYGQNAITYVNATDTGNYYDVAGGGLLELATTPDAQSTFEFPDTTTDSGTFAFADPGATIAASLAGLTSGDTIELPGTTVDSVTFGASNITITTDAGTYDFTNVSYAPGEVLNGFTAATDAATGLEAITFANTTMPPNSVPTLTLTASQAGPAAFVARDGGPTTVGVLGNGGVAYYEFFAGLTDGGTYTLAAFNANDALILSGYGTDAVLNALAVPGGVQLTLSDNTKIIILGGVVTATNFETFILDANHVTVASALTTSGSVVLSTTGSPTVIVHGTIDVADAGDTITIDSTAADGTTTVVGTATADADGNWSTAFALSPSLSYALTATASNALGAGTSAAINLQNFTVATTGLALAQSIQAEANAASPANLDEILTNGSYTVAPTQTVVVDNAPGATVLTSNAFQDVIAGNGGTTLVFNGSTPTTQQKIVFEGSQNAVIYNGTYNADIEQKTNGIAGSSSAVVYLSNSGSITSNSGIAEVVSSQTVSQATIGIYGSNNVTFLNASSEYLLLSGTQNRAVDGGTNNTILDTGSNDTIEEDGKGGIVVGSPSGTTVVQETFGNPGAFSFFSKGATDSLVLANTGPLTDYAESGSTEIISGQSSNNPVLGARIFAGTGTETIDTSALTGSAVITAGSGNATFIGGTNAADTYVFINGLTAGGTDTIKNFNSNDTLVFAGYGNSETQIYNSAVPSLVGTTLTLPDGTKLNFVGLTSAPPQSQTLLDGYIVGATVSYLNGSGGTTTTGPDGSFNLTGGTGPIIGSGGTDSATGLANTATFEAPAGSGILSPVTTLIEKVDEVSGDTSSTGIAAATAAVAQALGLASGTNLLTLDAEAGTLSGDATSTQVFTAGTELLGIDDLVAATGGNGASAIAGLAVTIADGGTIDLTNATMIASAASAGGLDTAAANAVGTIVAATAVSVASTVAAGGSASSLFDVISGAGIALQGDAVSVIAGVHSDAGFQSTAAAYVQNLPSTLIEATATAAALSQPSITIDPINGNNIITAAEASASGGVTITGSAAGLAAGTTFQVSVTDGSFSSACLATVNAAGTAWSATIPSTIASQLPGGTATISATAQNAYLNATAPVSQTVTVIVSPTISGPLSSTTTAGSAASTLNLTQNVTDASASATLTASALSWSVNGVAVSGTPTGVTVSGNKIEIDPTLTQFRTLAVGQSETLGVSYQVADQFGGTVTDSATIVVNGAALPTSQTFGYDALTGALTDIFTPGITGQSYDASDTHLNNAGKVTEIAYYTSGALTGDTLFNASGQETSATYGGLAFAWTYHSDGTYVITETGITGQAYTSQTFTYNAAGQVTQEAYSNGLTETFAYNSDGSYTDTATGFTGLPFTSVITAYAAGGALTSTTYAGFTTTGFTSYTNNAAGQLIQKTYANGLTESWTYHSDGSYDLTSSNITGQPFTSATVDYSSTGTVISTTYAGFTTTGFASYTANAAGQVTFKTYASGLTEAFAYNADGSAEVTSANIPGQAFDTVSSLYTTSGTLAEQIFTKAGSLTGIKDFNSQGAVTNSTGYTGANTATGPFGGATTIDLSAFPTPANVTVGFNEDASNAFGTLTIGQGNDVVKLTILGQYAGSFGAASDGHGGTSIAYTPPQQPVII